MRKKRKETIASICAASIVIALSACAALLGRSYSVKYEEGYEAGRESVLETVDEDAFSRGYEYGYEEGYLDGSSDFRHECDLSYEIEKAYDHARDNSEWSVYEAWNNILLYYGASNPYGFDIPTEEEFRQSVETLVEFCMYMDEIDLYD